MRRPLRSPFGTVLTDADYTRVRALGAEYRAATRAASPTASGPSPAGRAWPPVAQPSVQRVADDLPRLRSRGDVAAWAVPARGSLRPACGRTTISNPDAAATSSNVPSVGFACPRANNRRIGDGSDPTARANSAFDIIPTATRASSKESSPHQSSRHELTRWRTDARVPGRLDPARDRPRMFRADPPPSPPPQLCVPLMPRRRHRVNPRDRGQFPPHKVSWTRPTA